MIPMLVVPTLTRRDLLLRMLKSIDYPVQHLVVIDNSGKGGIDVEGPWERMTVLPMPTNLGVAASWNLAIRLGHKHPWVMICSDDMWWPEGAMQRLAEMASEDSVVVSSTWPHWMSFTFGMGIVKRFGLFDEGYYPAYFEDVEYERRMKNEGVHLVMGPATDHDNASTLNTPEANFGMKNAHSWDANKTLYQSGQRIGFDPFRWRDLSWQ